MSARAGTIVAFHVGGFHVEVSVPPVEPGKTAYMPCEWTPRVPDFEHDLTPDQVAEYRRRVDEAVAPREVIR